MYNPPKLIFPKIQKIKLTHFSLYSLAPKIDIEIPNGLFCLAGANGLGKSTFLAAVSFAITGAIPDPSREFKSSVEEHYKLSEMYSNNFFSGRILERDRELASISANLLVGNFVFQLTRGLFEPGELRELTVTNKLSNEVIVNGESLKPDKRKSEYQTRITQAIGLKTFDQFVFLQHFVLTFDESRHLLLWNHRALNHALHLCIGADYEKALLAGQLRREMERAGSLARNYNWRASDIRNQINVLEDVIKGGDENKAELENIAEQHQAIQEDVERLQFEVDNKRKAVNDANLKWIEISSELSAFESEYSKEYSQHIRKRSHVEFHPLVAVSISQKKCSLCGMEGEKVINEIKQRIDNNECPLCKNLISKQDDQTESISKLRDIDKRIADLKSKLNDTYKSKERILGELTVSENLLRAQIQKLSDFENLNEKIIIQLKSRSSGLEETISRKREEMFQYIQSKEKKYAERDKKKGELLKLERELRDRFLEAQEEFVPLFRKLATLFIGIDLDIRMDYSSSIDSLGLSLALEMRGIIRRHDYQLSESQRFFLDIALRMALAQYISAAAGQACLFIDTPEGSLDIAYESRAGKMFAHFVKTGHDIIMTANINSSQILRKLAQICGRSKMILHRMTTWTELSEVQLKEETLFNQAYDQIEHDLDAGGEDEFANI